MLLTELDIQNSGFLKDLDRLLDRGARLPQSVQDNTQKIIEQVRQRGDQAVLELTNQFDGNQFTSSDQLEIDLQQAQLCANTINQDLSDALIQSAQNIREFHQKSGDQSWQYQRQDGSILGQRVMPLERIGVYVPGGKATYPSSVLMTAIPAKVAGVKEIIMTVPVPNGEINAAVMAAACIAGVDRIFTIGGAQAVAAMAYGTETIPGVDKIVGPGNAYVACAKKQVFGDVDIDMIAGPSEVVVICDDSVNPDWVAMDLFAQAEHDELAQSIVISDSKTILKKIKTSISKLLDSIPRKPIIQQSLVNHGVSILVENIDQALDVANRIAPEHLQLMLQNAEAYIDKVIHAGAIFVGPYSAEVLGDYCAGPSHVLPTAGTARFSSPLSVHDFQKRSSIIQISYESAQSMSKIASVIAEAEGLTAHSMSAQYRLTKKK